METKENIDPTKFTWFDTPNGGKIGFYLNIKPEDFVKDYKEKSPNHLQNPDKPDQSNV